MKNAFRFIIGAVFFIAFSAITFAQDSNVATVMTIKTGEALTDSLFHSDCYIDVVQPEGMTPGQYCMTDDCNRPSEYSAKMRVAMLRFRLSCKLENEWKIVTDATAEQLKINPKLFDALLADLEQDNKNTLKVLTAGTMPREDLLALRAKMVGDFGRQHAIKAFTYYHRPFTL